MWKFALHNLFSRKVRTILSLLGLTVAILAMVGLFSVAEGLDAAFDDAFERIPGLIVIQPGAPVPLFSSLPAAWEEELRDVPGVRTVNAQVWQRANLVEGKLVTRKPRLLFGMDIPSRLALRKGVYRDSLVRGRFLEPDDKGTTNTVVSLPIAEEYEINVGDVLDVGGYELRIVGVYHTKSLLLDVSVLLDIDTVRRMTAFNPNAVSTLYVEQDGSVDDGTLVDDIEDLFRGRELSPAMLGSSEPSLLATIERWLGGGGDPSGPTLPRVEAGEEGADLPVEVKSADDWAEQVQEFAGDLDVFLLLLTGIGVTIAVLSIVNTMLMSVTERITEFGVLRANGWSPGDVMRLITLESAYIGFAGGVLGCLGGWAATVAVNEMFTDRIQLYASPGLLAFSLAFSTVLGVVGGLYPAWWAMRMVPMDAIRRG